MQGHDNFNIKVSKEDQVVTKLLITFPRCSKLVFEQVYVISKAELSSK